VEDMPCDELHEAVVDRAKRLAQMEPQELMEYIAALLELQAYGHRCRDIWAEPRDGEDMERKELFEGAEGQG
jgi:hypothetical protein